MPELCLVPTAMPTYQAAYGRGLPTAFAPAGYYYPGFPSYGLIPAATDRHTSPTAHYNFADVTTGMQTLQRSEQSPLPTLTSSPLQRDNETQALFTAHSQALVNAQRSAMTLASLQQVSQATSPIQSRQIMSASSLGPLDQLISMQDPLGYLQATSPQPGGFGGLYLTRVLEMQSWNPTQ